MELDVANAVGLKLHDVETAGESSAYRFAEALPITGTVVARAVQAGRVAEIEVCRRPEPFLEKRRMSGLRQEVEDASPVVVDEDDDEVETVPAASPEPVHVVIEGDVSDHEHHR